MAHFAIVITGLTGKFHTSLEMASRLITEGHEVTFLCPIDIKQSVEQYGHSYIQLPEVNFFFEDPELKTIQSSSWVKRFLFHFRHFFQHYNRGKRILHLETYKTILKNVNADHIIIDMELHDIIFPALTLDIPVTLFSTWFSNKISTNLPPLRSSIIPGQGKNGSKLGIIKAWIVIRLKTWLRLILNIITFKNYRRFVLKKYAKENGFPIESLITSNFPPLFSHTAMPIITMTMPELEFPHVPYKNLRYLGPMVFEDRDKNHVNSKISKQLDKIFEVKSKTGKKLIYCSIGSFVDGDPKFLQRLINALSSESEFLLVLSLGGKVPATALISEAKNIHIFDWVPQLKVMEQADCSINHGGINSINECIHFSVPMLIYSGKKFDQNGCAARMAYHGIAIAGDKDRDDELAIKANIHRLLSETSFSEKMFQTHQIYQQHRGKKFSSFLLE